MRAASRSRCGAQPANVAEPSGATRTNWRRLESTWSVAGFDLVGEQKEQMRLFAIVGRVHENGALAEKVAVLFQNQVAHGEHQRVAGMMSTARRPPGLSSGRTASRVKQTRS